MPQKVAATTAATAAAPNQKTRPPTRTVYVARARECAASASCLKSVTPSSRVVTRSPAVQITLR